MTSDPSGKLQLKLYNCHQTSSRKLIEIAKKNLTMKLIFNIARKELHIKTPSKIYFEEGTEVENQESLLANIVNGDSLYISNGQTLENSHEILNLCIMGAGGVGKSALTLRYVQNEFVRDYDPTIEDAFRQQIAIDGNYILLDILDTAGQDDFKCLRTSWMRNKDGFIFVFSIIKRKTFHALNEFIEEMKEVHESKVPPIILVGNKIDLANDDMDGNEDEEMDHDHDHDHDHDDDELSMASEIAQREVPFEEAVQFASKINAIAYIETSAKTAYNVRNMFGKVVRAIISKKYRKQSKHGNNTNNNNGKDGNNNGKKPFKCILL